MSQFVPSECYSTGRVYICLVEMCECDRYRLHLPGAVLDPLQVDIAEAGSRHPLQAVHVVLINLHTEDLRVALDVVPLGVGLQCLLDGGVLEPGGQFR